MKKSSFNKDEIVTYQKDVGQSAIKNPYDPSQIWIYHYNLILGRLLEMMKSEEIDLISSLFKKKESWNIQQKSQLIESLLLGLPIPALYFIETKGNKKAIIDGLQRLIAFKDFIIDIDSFELTGLEFLKQYEGKTYHDFSAEDKRKLSQFILHVFVIENETPEEIRNLIYERLN